MKKILLVAFCFYSLFVTAQTHSRFSYSPDKPYAGDVITIQYHPLQFNTNTSINCVAYIYDTTYQWHAVDISLNKKNDSLWTANFQTPKDAALIAYKFINGERSDNNSDQGFFTYFTPTTPYAVRGFYAGWGLFRSSKYKLGIPDYFNRFSISDSATYLWLNNEIIRKQGNAAIELVLPYIKSLLNAFGSSRMSEVNRALKYLETLNDSSENALVKAWFICNNYIKDTSHADSLKQIILTKFPHGNLAKYGAYNKILKAKSTEDRLNESKKFVSTYPYNPINDKQDELLGISYYNVFRNILSISIAQKNSDIIFKYNNILPYYNLPEAYYKIVEIPYEDWKTMDAETAFKYSDFLYKQILFFFNHQPSYYWYLSPKEYQTMWTKNFSSCLKIHAKILTELNKNEEALSIANQLQNFYQYRSSDLNETEAVLLERKKDEKNLRFVLEQSVKNNQATALIISMMEGNYIKEHKSDKGFDEWLNSLKDAKTIELMKQDILKGKLSLKAKPFVLEDNHKNKVSLENFKGKVVVLDFWATWCAPCKAGMAGMNMAVKKYAQDTSVVFLFVDTQEHINDYKKKSTEFIKEKNYRFTVLYDEGEGMEQTYKSYAKTSGIPYKVVIDKNGIIRFANIGYKGSPSGLADEISIMIELAKKEK